MVQRGPYVYQGHQITCRKGEFLILCPYNFMSQKQLIKLKNKSTGEIYFSRKNRKKVERKIKLKKYSAVLRKRVEFIESK